MPSCLKCTNIERKLESFKFSIGQNVEHALADPMWALVAYAPLSIIYFIFIQFSAKFLLNDSRENTGSATSMCRCSRGQSTNTLFNIKGLKKINQYDLKIL